jgi:hypothetical protein
MKILNQLLLITSMALTTISAQATTYKFQIQDTNVTSATFIGDSGSEVQITTDPVATQYDSANFIPVTDGFVNNYGNYGYYLDMNCDGVNNEIYINKSYEEDSVLVVNDIGYAIGGGAELYTDIDGVKSVFDDSIYNNVYDTGEVVFYVGAYIRDEGFADVYKICSYL